MGSWTTVAACLFLAGCLSPASPGSPSGSSSQTSTNDEASDAVRVGFGQSGLHIEAELKPAVVVPGGSVTVSAALVNDAGTAFTFQDCRIDSGANDDRGQAWGFEVRDRQRVYTAYSLEGLCPGDPQAPRATLPAGERQTLVHTWGRFDTQGAPPGSMWFNLSFHGVTASLPFALSFGEGGGEPVVRVEADRATLHDGERVLVNATVTNPTQRSFRYQAGGCGDVLAFQISTSQGTAFPPRADCQPPVYETNLAPGQSLQGSAAWNGKWYGADGVGTLDPGTHTITVAFAYTDGEGLAGVATTSVNVTVQ